MAHYSLDGRRDPSMEPRLDGFKLGKNVPPNVRVLEPIFHHQHGWNNYERPQPGINILGRHPTSLRDDAESTAKLFNTLPRFSNVGVVEVMAARDIPGLKYWSPQTGGKPQPVSDEKFILVLRVGKDTPRLTGEVMPASLRKLAKSS